MKDIDLYWLRRSIDDLHNALSNLQEIKKLPRVQQQMEFMIDGLDEYINLKINEDELESRYGDFK